MKSSEIEQRILCETPPYPKGEEMSYFTNAAGEIVSPLTIKGFHGHPRFYELLQEMADLHSRKNHDYSGDDPLSNLRSVEEIGVPAWKGVLVRLMDKWGRLKTFAKKEHLEVKDESIIDTLMDNAVYSLLCIILLEREVQIRENLIKFEENAKLSECSCDPPLNVLEEISLPPQGEPLSRRNEF